jgi:hypothetical protein
VDEITQLLDRAVLASLSAAGPPSADVIARRARRRSFTRSVASVTLVLAMTLGVVIGLATAGRATETPGDLTAAPVATQPAVTHAMR